jgi:uncharacterized membrane protein
MERCQIRFVVLASLLFSASYSCAIPPFLEEFKKSYELDPKEHLAKAGCAICHVSPPAHNSYGADVKKALSGSREISGIVLMGLDDQDSDGDGFSNGEEIQARSLPGDKASTPENVPPPSAAPSPAESGFGIGLPKHAFHPTLVHFPIALYIFGAFLDFVGFQRKMAGMRQAGWWNMLAGTIFTVFAIPTGLLASFGEGYPLVVGTPVFLHLMLAVGATLMMVLSLVWIRRKPEPTVVYWIWLFLSVVVLGMAGHFGGMLVYG